MEAGLKCAVHDRLILLRYIGEPSVPAVLPCERLKSLPVCYHKLVFEHLVHIQGKSPLRIGTVIERMHLLPVSESFSASSKGKDLIRAYVCRLYGENHIRILHCPDLSGCSSAEDGTGEG